MITAWGSMSKDFTTVPAIHRFHWAHIWSCPPTEGDDYIFHCHPVTMKFLKQKKLVDWYKRCLEKAIDENIVFQYKVSFAISFFSFSFMTFFLLDI